MKVPAAIDRRRRENYITWRSKEIVTRITALAAEREELTGKLKGVSGGGADLKRMRDRRMYVADRLQALRHEQKTLAEERRASFGGSGPPINES